MNNLFILSLKTKKVAVLPLGIGCRWKHTYTMYTSYTHNKVRNYYNVLSNSIFSTFCRGIVRTKPSSL